MGLSKSKSTSKTNESIAPTPYAQPYIDSAAATLKPAYDESLAVSKQFQPALNSAASFYGDTMGGKFLDQQNPYLDQMVHDSNDDITEQVNQQFMPRFGSGYHAKALAEQLGKNETALRYGNYATERGYQNQAGQNVAGIAATATALPQVASQGYAQGTAGLLGRYLNSTGTQNTTSSPSLLQTILGAAAGGAGAYFGGK